MQHCIAGDLPLPLLPLSSCCLQVTNTHCLAGRPACLLLQVVRDIVPLLEGLVAAEYPLWRPSAAAMAAAQQSGADGGTATGTGMPSGAASGGDKLGEDAVSSLSCSVLCLGEGACAFLLLECGCC